MWRAIQTAAVSCAHLRGVSGEDAGPSNVAAGTEPRWQIPGRQRQIKITQYLTPGLYQQRRARILTLLDYFG